MTMQLRHLPASPAPDSRESLHYRDDGAGAVVPRQTWLFAVEDDHCDEPEGDTFPPDFFAMTVPEMAEELGCSERQVRQELRDVYRKLRRHARQDPEFKAHVIATLGQRGKK
jgi:hypothetical protein